MMKALLLEQFSKALGGSTRALEDLLDRMDRYSPPDVQENEELPEEDQIILERALAGRGVRSVPPAPGRSEEGPYHAGELADEAAQDDGAVGEGADDV